MIDQNRKFLNVCQVCYPSEKAKNENDRSAGKIRERILEA